MQKQLSIVTAIGLVLSSTHMASADALNDNHVVWDSNGHAVHSKVSGECVRTKWESGQDICAPQVAAVPVERTVLSSTEKTVYFEFDSAVLTPEARQQLDTVAQTLRGAKDVKDADIVGFADRIGSTPYNKDLSRRRAEAVKNYLAQRGYVNSQVAETRGLGEAQPTTTCDPALSRNQQINCLSPDRRVEVELKYLDTERVSSAQ